MKKLLALAASAAALTTFAFAQDDAPTTKPAAKNYFGGGIGGFALADDEVTYDLECFGFACPTDPQGTTKNDVSVGFAVNLNMGRFISKYVAIEGELGVFSATWDGFENGAVEFVCREDECLDQQITNVTLTGNVIFSAPLESKARPYAGIGAGFIGTSYNIEDENDRGFGVVGKAGIDFRVAERSRIGIKYEYIAAPDVDFLDTFEFSPAGGALLITAKGLF